MLPSDERIVESIAKAMVEYDKSSSEKSWRELARVAYITTIRNIAYEKIQEGLIQRG